MPNPDASEKKWLWRNARWIPSAVLLAAATLKVLNTPLILEGGGLLSNPALLYATIFGELLCSVLIAMLPANLSWLLTLTVFSLLLVVASVAQIGGLSCNCFGDALPPWASIAIDVSMLATCLTTRPAMEGSRTSISNTALTALGVAVIGVAAASYRDASANKDDPLEFLLADELISSPWPINSTLAESLTPIDAGNWMILVVREDCEHCRELLEHHFRQAERHRKNERTAVFIAGNTEWAFALDRIALEGPFDGTIAWPSDEPFVASPAVFVVKDGVVTAAADGDESSSLMTSLFDGDY